MMRTLADEYECNWLELRQGLLRVSRGNQEMSVSLLHAPKNLDELKTFLSTLFHPENWQKAIRSLKGNAPIQLKNLPH
jgi:hypothetical protein